MSDNNEPKNSFRDGMKAEVNYDYVKIEKEEQFLDMLEKHPEFLYKLSLEDLKKIEKCCDESIARYDEKIAKLKKKKNSENG